MSKGGSMGMRADASVTGWARHGMAAALCHCGALPAAAAQNSKL